MAFRQGAFRLLVSISRTLFYVTVGSLVLVAGFIWFFMTWEPDRTQFAIRGIDVSHHQGDIDWEAVARDDVAFAYIKASEGGDFKDPAFSRNWANARSAGVAHGAYHFFSFCKPGAEQAVNFLEAVPLTEAMLPPVLDLEAPVDCAEAPGREDVLKEIEAFVTFVEGAINHQVMLYVPEDTYIRYLAGQETNRKIWVRSMWRQPDYVHQWSVWQYSDRGTVQGIAGDVDLNVLMSDLTLDKLIH